MINPREARAIIRQAVKRVPEGEEIRHLNIMPMMDIMTILLVAFLFSASQDAALAIGDATLPASRSAARPASPQLAGSRPVTYMPARSIRHCHRRGSSRGSQVTVTAMPPVGTWSGLATVMLALDAFGSRSRCSKTCSRAPSRGGPNVVCCPTSAWAASSRPTTSAAGPTSRAVSATTG